MKTEPVATALRAITEAKQLIETLITSSETFDYREAKRSLKALRRKLRELGRLQSSMEDAHKRRVVRAPNVYVVDFQNARALKDSHAH